MVLRVAYYIVLMHLGISRAHVPLNDQDWPPSAIPGVDPDRHICVILSHVNRTQRRLLAGALSAAFVAASVLAQHWLFRSSWDMSVGRTIIWVTPVAVGQSIAAYRQSRDRDNRPVVAVRPKSRVRM